MPRVQVLLPLPKQKDTCGCLFVLAGAEGLEPRNSKVLALLTVNSPVDCLRIELIIKPLPKKAPNFRCFLPLFTAIYADSTYFSHIDKTTAHGLFRTPNFHFHTFFVHFVPHNPPNPFGTSSKKHQILQLLLSNSHYIPSLVFFAIVSIWIPFSCKSFISHININSIFIVGIKNYTISLIVSNMV